MSSGRSGKRNPTARLPRVVLHVGRQTTHLQSKRTDGAHAVALLHYVD